MYAGLRIDGELVARFRWNNVDLTEGVVSVVEFSTYLGRDRVAASSGEEPRHDPACRHRQGPRRRVASTEPPPASRRRRSGWQQTSTRRPVTSSPARPVALPPHTLSRLLGRYSEELGLPRLTAHGLGTLAQRSCSPMAWHRRSQLSGSGSDPCCSWNFTVRDPVDCGEKRRRSGPRCSAEDFGLRCDSDLDAQLDSWTPIVQTSQRAGELGVAPLDRAREARGMKPLGYRPA